MSQIVFIIYILLYYTQEGGICVTFGRQSYIPTKIYSVRMVKVWFGGDHILSLFGTLLAGFLSGEMVEIAHLTNP